MVTSIPKFTNYDTACILYTPITKFCVAGGLSDFLLGTYLISKPFIVTRTHLAIVSKLLNADTNTSLALVIILTSSTKASICSTGDIVEFEKS